MTDFAIMSNRSADVLAVSAHFCDAITIAAALNAAHYEKSSGFHEYYIMSDGVAYWETEAGSGCFLREDHPAMAA